MTAPLHSYAAVHNRILVQLVDTWASRASDCQLELRCHQVRTLCERARMNVPSGRRDSLSDTRSNWGNASIARSGNSPDGSGTDNDFAELIKALGARERSTFLRSPLAAILLMTIAAWALLGGGALLLSSLA
jgi:hypothetical protein